MPSWKDTLTDRQMWTLALFLKHMDKLPPAAEKVWQQVRNSVAPRNQSKVDSGTTPQQAGIQHPIRHSATGSE